METNGKWEEITTQKELSTCTDRLKVPGGWIVRTRISTIWQGCSIHSSMEFIKDPGHEWKIIPTE